MKKRLLVASLCVMFSFVANVILAQSFKQGEKLTWTTSADKGELWVSWKSGNRFGLDQTNKNNPAAGVVKMTGEYRGGKYYISNPEYGEEWVGTERNGVISGRINGQMSFKITRQNNYGGNSGSSSSSSYYGKSIFTYGKKLYWSSDRDKGVLKVTWASGNNFRLDQTNYNNPGAGVVKLNGEYRNGKYYISNPEYGENWVGTERNGTISGNINGGVSFKISTSSYGNSNNNNNSNSYSRNFFTYGKKLYWKSDNNIGEMKVTWASGDRFNIDQKNYNAPGAGTIKMTGEYRNGTYYISCVRYNEKWIGTERGGTVSGKVNNRVNFKISTSSYGYNNSNNNNSSNNNYSSILKVGKRFKWNNGNNEGLIIVKSVSGSNFVIEQSNYDNPSAGWVKMNGSFRNGVYTIYNPKWNETWRLQERYGKLEGKINNSINIVLTPTSSSSSSNGNSSNSSSPGYRPNNNYENNNGRIGDDIIR